MTFAPRKETLKELKERRRSSPPSAAAEIAARFDANIRTFTGRHRSPKNFLRRKKSSPVLIKSPVVVASPQKRKQKPPANAFKEQQPRRIFATSPTTDKLRDALFSPTSPALFSPTSPAGLRTARAGTLGFGTASVDDGDGSTTAASVCSSTEDLRTISASSAREPRHFFALPKTRGASRSRSPSPHVASRPFWTKQEVSPLWIATHAALNETQQVEEMLRMRIEQLQLAQLKIIWNFCQDLVL